MNLAEERAAVALEPVDLMELPQRSLAVERPREQARYEPGELRQVTRGPELVADDVMADVELRRGFPRGMRNAERHRHHALRVARDQVKPRRHVVHEAREVERVLGDRHRAHVEELAGPLEVEERRVERGHPVAGAHVPSSTKVTSTVARYSATLPSSTAAFSFSTSIPVMLRSVRFARSRAFRTASSQLWGEAPMICVCRATAMLILN